MKESNIAPILAGTILREQIRGKNDVCFQETRISDIPFDKSIKQGRKESPCLFELDMMKSVFKTMQEEWKNLHMMTKIRGSGTGQEEERVSHMIFVDNCYLFAETKDQILMMIGDATGSMKKRGSDWKEGQMELISWGLDEKIGELKIDEGGKEYVIKEVDSLRTVGALITKEADSMSAMRFRINTADKAMWKGYQILQEQGDCGGKQTRYIQESGAVVHSSSWNKEMVDALHEWASKNLDLVRSRRWAQKPGMVQGHSDQES